MFDISQISRREEDLAQFCSALDPASIPLSVVAQVYESFARMERLVTGAKLRLAARVEASNHWRTTGHRTAADWLARTAGSTAAAAHSELAASTRLERLPATDDALRQGGLSVAQAAAVTDAAAADPGAEARLLAAAERSSLRALRDECARTKAAADPDADARYARIRRERLVRTYTDAEGAWNLHARGPADAGAQVTAALQAAADALFRQAYTEGRQEPHGAYQFDALVGLCSGRGGGRQGHKYRAVLRVDVEALIRGATDNDERCEITGVGPIPVRVARDLLGDAVIDLVITRGQDVTTVVHLGRGPSAAQRVALMWTQPTCSREGCEQLWTHTEVDHRLPWSETHHTVLGELDRLCRHDHRLKTNHGWALVAGGGTRPMVPPGHPDHPGSMPTERAPP
ncbi:MAG TPA: HNH endonuclease signature motif containing protein [Acidimicrobiales bacterium]|jgi:hypothetical protein